MFLKPFDPLYVVNISWNTAHVLFLDMKITVPVQDTIITKIYAEE